MRIIGKCRPVDAQIQSKLDVGCKEVELHMMEEDVKEGFVRVVEEKGLKVRVVHMPLKRKYKVEGIATNRGFEVLKTVCKELKRGLVVLHMECNLEQLQEWGIYSEVVKNIGLVLQMYPSIELGIENETVYEISGGKWELKNNHYMQIIKVVEQLREDLGVTGERVGIVFDTCHAIATERLLEPLVKMGVAPNCKLEEYIHKYTKYLKLVHLANARGLGYDQNHGIGFDTEEEEKLLENILGTLKEEGYTGLCTLEVQEPLRDSSEYIKLRKKVEKYLS